MLKDIIYNMCIDEILSAEAGQKIREIIEAISSVQKGIYTLKNNEDCFKLDLLKIGTVFQIFFIDTLAAGKKPGDLTEEDWKNIAEKVYEYAVIEEGRSYSEFVFSLYADYIDISIEAMQDMISQKSIDSARDVTFTIRENIKRFRNDEVDEPVFIEACLWLSLEGMMKLICSFFTTGISQEYAYLIQSVSQLAFEYGRYVLYSKEQEILERYIANQHILDERLRQDYEMYLEEVSIQAEAFQKLIEDAFTPGITDALINSAALARAAGVNEEELLTSVEDIDSFFMD